MIGKSVEPNPISDAEQTLGAEHERWLMVDGFRIQIVTYKLYVYLYILGVFKT